MEVISPGWLASRHGRPVSSTRDSRNLIFVELLFKCTLMHTSTMHRLKTTKNWKKRKYKWVVHYFHIFNASFFSYSPNRQWDAHIGSSGEFGQKEKRGRCPSCMLQTPHQQNKCSVHFQWTGLLPSGEPSWAVQPQAKHPYLDFKLCFSPL